MTMARILVISAAAPPLATTSSSVTSDSQINNQKICDISNNDVADTFDRHNRPRSRRNIILAALQRKYSQIASFRTSTSTLELSCNLINLFSPVHDIKMLHFLLNAWSDWMAMGPNWDKDNCHPEWNYAESGGEPPPLIPIHSAFRRDGIERPSSNVMGAIGYYCTDFITPIVGKLVQELTEDACIICSAVHCAFLDDHSDDNHHPVVTYAVTTHPGHHASYDCFGGYCYLNNAALCARLMQRRLDTGNSIISSSGEIVNQYWNSQSITSSEKNFNNQQNSQNTCRVAILDIDYHVGNGTASIFYNDPNVLVISIHCDPEIDYPWNSGFADQIGAGLGEGATLHIPLQKGATWEGAYKEALNKAMLAIVQFNPRGLVVSLGLDTYDGDNVAVNRGGFRLKGGDYYDLGLFMGKYMKGRNVPCIFVQEGGYKMDVVGDAAADVVGGYALGVGDSTE